MSITPADIKKIAHLARLNVDEQDLTRYTEQLGNIMDFVEQMTKVDTTNISPCAHALDVTQPLRADVVTAVNERDAFQKIAPQVEAGLYLVPQVIDGDA